MHFKFSRLILFLLIFLPATWLFANEKRKSAPKLVQFHMALLKKGPKWETTAAAERSKILQQHLANVLSMLDSGKAVIAGPMGDDTDVAGIFILRARSQDLGRRRSCGKVRTVCGGDASVVVRRYF